MTDDARMADDGCTNEGDIPCCLCDRMLPSGRIHVFWKTIGPGHYRSVAICNECLAIVRTNET